MKILIIDNFDSFTYNLYQLVGEVLNAHAEHFSVDVVRNDAITIEEIEVEKYDRILISPGPGNPKDKEYFGICEHVLQTVSKIIPTLGVCLGMQGIASSYGGKIVEAVKPMHGKASVITHDGHGIFAKLPQKLEVMRYHSLVVSDLPSCFIMTASVDAGTAREIMGLRHVNYPIEGIQFHPESFATEGGKKMIENFLYAPYNPLDI